MDLLKSLLEKSSVRHSHLCPRQVLGVRMAIAGAALLGMEIPRTDKDMIVITETDGCFLDGLEVATGATPGHRTLRIMDYGKVAATFANVKTGQAIRLSPRPTVREAASKYAPAEKRHYFAQLIGYQLMPDEELFVASPVVLTPSASVIMSRPGVRSNCTLCGEEIINEREIVMEGQVYCRSCHGQAYFAPVESTSVVIRVSQLVDPVTVNSR